jgi:hypothetical protein
MEGQTELKRGAAGPLLLTGLGLSFITVGNYVAWGFGLEQGGIGGLLIALGAVALLFLCLVSCLGELSAMMPSAGGGYAFAQRGLGPTAGLLAGAAITLEYVCGTAALAAFSASYLEALTGVGGRGVIAALYVIVCVLNAAGVGEALCLADDRCSHRWGTSCGGRDATSFQRHESARCRSARWKHDMASFRSEGRLGCHSLRRDILCNDRRRPFRR